MSVANNILIVSDKQNDILNFHSKLVLLRDIDSVIGSSIEKAVEFCRRHIPDTVIVFVHDRNEKVFDVCKVIRNDSVLKNIPIIFIFDIFDEEFILSSFDAGISDYVVLPARESDIVIRVIWCLQRSELVRELEKKQVLLSELGVSDKDLGIYTPQFVSRVFTTEINSAKKYRSHLVLMAIAIDQEFMNEINSNNLAGIIKKSIRKRDIMGMPETGKFYLILPKTGIEGANIVYEKIKKNIGSRMTISAGVCESYEEMSYESMSKTALNALNQAIADGGDKIIVNNADSNAYDPDDPKSWMNRVSNKRNSESVKREFEVKINNIISPVFNKIQSGLTRKYSTDILITHSVSDSACYFSLKEPYGNSEAILKIIDTGSSKIMIDTYLNRAGDKTANRQALELKDLTEENVVKALQNLFFEFKKAANLKD